jgi:hypothetical protein
MTTSGVRTFNVSRDDIVKGALRKIGAIATGEPISYDEINEASLALNLLIKEWMAEGIGIWLYDTFSIPLVVNQESYTLGVGGDVTTVGRPLSIVESRYHYYTDNRDLPMSLMTRDRYFALPVKNTSGIPTQYYYEPQLVMGVFYIWPIITATTSDTVRATARVEVEDFDTAANTADFPKEWFSALLWNLAMDLAPEYGKEPSPFIVQRASLALMRAQGQDRESSVFLGLDRV